MKTPKLIAFVIFLYIGLFCFTYCSPKEPMTLKVMSYNIRHGEGLDTLLDPVPLRFIGHCSLP
jgi:hypothetical protein